jgi:hypothetical protein
MNVTTEQRNHALAQTPAYGFTVPQARMLLMRLKEVRVARLTFMPDQDDVFHLPTWVRTAKQITGGHLSQCEREW